MLEALVHAFAEPALVVRGGRIVVINARAQALLAGLGAEPGAPVAGVLRPRRMAAVGADLADLLDGRAGATVATVGVSRGSEGETDLQLEIAVSPLGDGAARACFVVLRDLGAIAGDEAERLRGYRRIVDRANDLVFAHDLEGRILYANAATRRALGYEPDELVGMSVKSVVPPGAADDAMWERRRRRMAGDATTFLYEVDLVAKDGRSVPYEVGSTSIEEGGRTVAVFVIARDITERRRAQEALRRSEERFRAAAEGGFDAFFLMEAIRDAGGSVCDFRIVELNERALELVGVRREHLIGRSFRETVKTPGRDAFIAKCARVMETGRPFEEEFQPESPDVRAAWVRHQVIPVGDGVAVTARDVTERHRLEEELRHSQRMEAVGRLAGGIAHDFNNLLTAINGYGELLLSRVPEDDALRIDVHEICSAGERAAALTQQLLAFSRRQLLKPERLDLSAVVADMDKMLRRLIGEHIGVETRLAPDPCLVHADRGQLQQVVMNLVVNARDAMESGGTLTLETANLGGDGPDVRREPGAPPGRYAMLLVRDTGCGMDEETLAHVFEPFFTTKPSGKGTGLGLSMVYGIVQQSGGQVAARSKPGQGSTFRIFLPLAPAEAAVAAAPAPEAAAAGGRETVLLVEDEALVARLAERVLSEAGYTVLRASDGVEAEQVFQQHSGTIDLLVSDVVMPHLGGPELAERLRTARTDLPVLFLSGYNDSAVLGRGLLRRDTSFLGKPFNPAALAAEVRRLLDDRAR